MKVTTERLPDCKVKLTVEIDPERLKEPLRQTTRRLSRRMRIPGFRPGKAPFSVIVRRFGREALLAEVVEKEGQGWYRKALEEAELESYGQAQLEITSHDPLVIIFTLPVAPVVDLGEYQDLRLDWEPSVVSDEEVEKELARLQQENVSLEPRERPAELEDVVTLDIEGRFGDKVVVDVKERAVMLTPDVSYPVTGFAERIMGLSPGKDREFTLTYPQDHANTAWAGKEAHFRVHMHSLKVRVTPELNDELARTIGDYETLDEWRASVREQLETRALNLAEQDYANAVVEALANQAHVEFPAVMVERQLDSMMKEIDQSLQQRGLGLENYLVIAGQSQEEYRESLRETAEKRLKNGLVLEELIQTEGLEISEVDVEAKIDLMAEALSDKEGNLRQGLANEEMREFLRRNSLTQAAVDILKAIGRGEYVARDTVEPEEEGEKEEKDESEATLEAEPTETAEEMTKEMTEENTEAMVDEASPNVLESDE